MLLSTFIDLVRRTADITRSSSDNEKIIVEAYNNILLTYVDKGYKYYRVTRRWQTPQWRAGNFAPVVGEPFQLDFTGSMFDDGFIPFVYTDDFVSDVEYYESSGGILHLQRQVPSTFIAKNGKLYVRGIDLSAIKCDVIREGEVVETVMPSSVFSVSNGTTLLPNCEEYEFSDSVSSLNSWCYIAPRLLFKNPLSDETSVEVKFYRQPIMVDLSSYDKTKITVDFPAEYSNILVKQVAAAYFATMGQPESAEYLKAEMKDRIEAMDEVQRGASGNLYNNQRRQVFVRARRYV